MPTPGPCRPKISPSLCLSLPLTPALPRFIATLHTGAVLHAAESSSFSYALAPDDLPMESSHLIESDGIGSDCLMRCDY